MKKVKFPHTLEYYKKLVICTNELFDGGQLMMVGDDFPLVVGKGGDGSPLVWLEGVNAGELTPVISASKSVHPLLRVDKGKRRFSAFIGAQKVINISSSGDEAIVDFLDLRLVGFEIYGDDKKLMFAGSQVYDNKFLGSAAMFAVPSIEA